MVFEAEVSVTEEKRTNVMPLSSFLSSFSSSLLSSSFSAQWKQQNDTVFILSDFSSLIFSFLGEKALLCVHRKVGGMYGTCIMMREEAAMRNDIIATDINDNVKIN